MPTTPFSLLLVTALTAGSPAGPPVSGISYQTTKSLSVIEQCLTEKLTLLGDVTAIKIDGTHTLMLREANGPPMLIDLASGAVTVTTNFAIGTRRVVESCL